MKRYYLAAMAAGAILIYVVVLARTIYPQPPQPAAYPKPTTSLILHPTPTPEPRRPYLRTNAAIRPLPDRGVTVCSAPAGATVEIIKIETITIYLSDDVTRDKEFAAVRYGDCAGWVSMSAIVR